MTILKCVLYYSNCSWSTNGKPLCIKTSDSCSNTVLHILSEIYKTRSTLYFPFMNDKKISSSTSILTSPSMSLQVLILYQFSPRTLHLAFLLHLFTIPHLELRDTPYTYSISSPALSSCKYSIKLVLSVFLFPLYQYIDDETCADKYVIFCLLCRQEETFTRTNDWPPLHPNRDEWPSNKNILKYTMHSCTYIRVVKT